MSWFENIIETVKIARVLYNFTKDVEETIYLCRTIVRWLCGHDSFVDFFYIWGEGGSGKDFLWRVLCSLFNDEEDGYAVGESGDMITDIKSGFKESASPTLMSWMGKRLITFTEVADKPLDIDAIKPLTEQRGSRRRAANSTKAPRRSIRPSVCSPRRSGQQRSPDQMTVGRLAA